MNYNNSLTLKAITKLTTNPQWLDNSELSELVEGLGEYMWNNTMEKPRRKRASNEMYYLQWQSKYRVDNLGIYSSEEDALQAVYNWWELNDFKPHYIRTWNKDGVLTVDYGFHTYFYKITRIDKHNFNKIVERGMKNEK